MEKERFIESGWQRFTATQRFFREKRYAAVASVNAMAASSGLGWTLAEGLSINHPLVITFIVGLGASALAIRTGVKDYRRERAASQQSLGANSDNKTT